VPSKSKPKTQAQLDRAADLRLLKSYGRGLDWYNEQFERQFGGCAVCGDGPKTRRLHVDHDHSWVKVKIYSEKTRTRAAYQAWSAWADYNGNVCSDWADTKSSAIKSVKQMLRVSSVRALLCHRCNRAMILFKDKANILRLAADYLERHQKGLTI
jgi:hypothetical protein